MNDTRPTALHLAVLQAMPRAVHTLRSSFTPLALAAAALALPQIADAQDIGLDGSEAAAHWTLGAAAARLPVYEGADEMKTRALPLVSYRNGRFFAGALGGIGYIFSPVAHVQFGPVLSYRPGRDESDSPRLRGLGDIDAGADIGAFVRWNLRPFFVHASVKKSIGGDVDGIQIKLGAGYGFALSPADRIVLDASIDWADKETMQTTFGVTGAQAARSGLPVYEPGSGIRRHSIGALWTHAFSSQWFGTVGVAAYRLGDDAGASPFVADRNGAAVSAGFGYRF